MEKTFYVVSALRSDASLSDARTRHDDEKGAIERAKWANEQRLADGRPPIAFYILKAELIVGPVLPEIKVTRLKKTTKRKKRK